MNELERFYEMIKRDMTVILATSAGGSVTMRAVSPVYYEGSILIFTSPDSVKYRQLRENPNCCVAAGTYFAQAAAEFLGPTMLEENAKLRDAYAEKFADAFAEGVEFGGRGMEFILLKPTLIKGWDYADGAQGEDGIPTVPFEIAIP